MQTLHQILHYLKPDAIINAGGLTLICVVIFAETGFFALLPGDSLLVLAGFLASRTDEPVHLSLWGLLTLPVACAIAGDQLGYYIGRKVGEPLYRWKDRAWLGIPIFKHEYLVQTQKLYKNYGVATVILARFVPIARTFAPLLAGVGRMTYSIFLTYNVLGGLLWVWLMVLLGYFLPLMMGLVMPDFDVKANMGKVELVVIIVSLLPGLYHVWSERRKVALAPVPAPRRKSSKK